MPPFAYARLEKPDSQIRLFQLISAPGRRLRGTLVHVDLEAARGSYDPLSYCWGGQNRRVSILVNGRSFNIRRNLYAALKNILRHHESRYAGAGEMPSLVMWVDALCINQDDPDEKNAQVPMMRDIYANGRRTHVWLGPHNIWTALAFHEIRVWAAFERGGQRRKDGPQVENEDYYDEAEEELESLYHSQGLLARLVSKVPPVLSLSLISVTFRPWFFRSWVVQEMATSKCITMVCGKHHMDWDDMEMAFKSSSTSLDNSIATGTPIETLIAIRRSFRNAEYNSLETLLWSTNTFQTTDPRDRIFSLFGLVTSHRHHEPDTALDSFCHTRDITIDTGVSIDYSATIKDVYIETTIHCLRTSGYVGILAVCLGTRKTELGDDFPTWVLNPDPSMGDPRGYRSFAWALPNPLSDRGPGNAGGWTASGLSSRCSPELDKENTLLGLQGIILDTVTHIGPEREGFMGLSGGLRNIYDRAKNITQNIKCYMEWRALSGVPKSPVARETTFYRGRTGCKTTHEAFLEIMCPRLPTGFENDAVLADKHGALCKHFDHFIMSTFLGFLENKASRGKTTTLSMFYDTRIAARYIKAAAAFEDREDGEEAADLVPRNSFSHFRRFVRTEKGYIGLGGTHASVGDKVVLFAGSPAPFLIRKAEPKTVAAGGSDDATCSSPDRVRYKIVCDAYFVDMMAGELWDPDRCETIWLE